MAGIYIHIPYCRKACHYCDFHFSTSIKSKDAFIDALLHEIKLQKDFFNEKSPRINSIYFGGGTPSVLDTSEIEKIILTLHSHFQISERAEITLEANPDDLKPEKLKGLKDASINRLSIGIQSFFDNDLQEMNRAHNASMAINSIKHAKEAGFENISIDLIYGIPEQSDESWTKNLEQAFALDIAHLSCYSLTVEPGTALAHFVKTGKKKDVDEDKIFSQFQILTEMTSKHNYQQYEISNFCKNEMYSLHNSNYWKAEKYLGLGPSAHSFNGLYRQFNISNNIKYINAIRNNTLPFEKELLNENEKFNEYILISLRTMWGCNYSHLEDRFGSKISNYFKSKTRGFMESGLLQENNNSVILTHKGKLVADFISRELFITN